MHVWAQLRVGFGLSDGSRVLYARRQVRRKTPAGTLRSAALSFLP
jgi:hypothetical protein